MNSIVICLLILIVSMFLVFGIKLIVDYRVKWKHELATGSLSIEANKIINSLHCKKGWVYKIVRGCDGDSYCLLEHDSGIKVHPDGAVTLNSRSINAINTRFDMHYIAKAYGDTYRSISKMNDEDKHQKFLIEEQKRIENEQLIIDKL